MHRHADAHTDKAFAGMYPKHIADRVKRRAHALDVFLVEALKVHSVPNPSEQLRRVGPDSDGGYLVYSPDGSGVMEYDGFISAGVGHDVTFETQFLELHGNLHCDVFDHTVAGLPTDHPRLHWVPKPMGSQPLASFLATRNDVFFKCDIEGAEWETLDGASQHLPKIKQLVLEIHGLGDGQWPWGAWASVEQQRRVLEALARTHYLVHARGNTCSPPVPFCGVAGDTTNIPEVLELTYVRKDVFPGSEALARNTQPLPRPQEISGETSHPLIGEPWQSKVDQEQQNQPASMWGWVTHVKHIAAFVNQFHIETRQLQNVLAHVPRMPAHARNIAFGDQTGTMDLVIKDLRFAGDRQSFDAIDSLARTMPALRPGGFACFFGLDAVDHAEFLRLMRKLRDEHIWDTCAVPCEFGNFAQFAVDQVVVGACNTWCVVRRRCGGVTTPPTTHISKDGKGERPKVVAVNYAANGLYVARLPEANASLSAWGVDAIVSFGPHDFSAAFKERNAKALQTARGAGWWCWKGLIQLWAMEACADADYILYCDVGVTPRQPLAMLLREAGAADIVSLQLEFPQHVERRWSKSDAFVATGTLGNAHVRDTLQVASGFTLMKRNPTVELALRLYAALMQQPHLTDNTPSRESFDTEKKFVENRHDQSVWSTMMKKFQHDGGPAVVRLLPFESWIHHHRNIHDPVAPKLLVKHPGAESSSSKEIHIIVQPYNDPHPERRAEILDCMRNNGHHPAVTKVHAMLECDAADPFAAQVASCMPRKNGKFVPSFGSPRMTFATAIKYANDSKNIPFGATVCIVNADIYMFRSKYWDQLCADGTPQFLTRWEEHPNGDISMNEEFFTHGHSCDAWCFQTPVHSIPEIGNIRVGNQLGCDGFVAGRTIDAGLIPRNDAIKFPFVHLDKCAHRNRVHTSIFSAVDDNASAEKTMTHIECHGAGARLAQLRVGCASDEERQTLSLCDFSRIPVSVLDRHFDAQRNVFGDTTWKWA